jgi:hypothetical protein
MKWSKATLDEMIQRNRKLADFESALRRLVNSESLEQYCDIPDYVIASYLRMSFENLCMTAEFKVNWKPEDVGAIVRDMQEGSSECS